MPLTDANGLAVSCDDRATVERLDRAGRLFAAYRADPLAEIDAAITAGPGCVMAHCMRAGLMAISTERGLERELELSLADAAALAGRANERERAHIAAASAWAARDFDRAADRYGAIVAEWPRDLFAMQVSHQLDFFLGRREALRDRPGRALATAWGVGDPGYGFVLGMHAFGLEENGDYAEAENAGRWAVALERTDAWSVHAVAHVMEMQGRAEEGATWLRRREADWAAPDAMMACHNWWHLALFHLDRGEGVEALAVYDRGVRPKPGAAPPALELVDASAMLWRLRLARIEPGPARWAEVADLWAPQAEDGYYAFNDAHAVMAFLGAGRPEEARRTLRAMERAAAGRGSNAAMTREVGLPLARGLVALEAGAPAEAAGLLAPLPAVAHRFGGSNAQRDIIALTLAEALLRAGETGAARTMAEARLRAKPDSALARRLAERAGRMREVAMA